MEHKAALLVSADDEDHRWLGDVFCQQGWTLYRAVTLDTALAFLCDNPVPVLITERDLPLGDWKDLFATMLQLPRAPLLIVASLLADEHLWAEVLNLGGHDVLCKPFETKEVLWVLSSAWEFAERAGVAMHPRGKRDGACSLVALEDAQ